MTTQYDTGWDWYHLLHHESLGLWGHIQTSACCHYSGKNLEGEQTRTHTTTYRKGCSHLDKTIIDHRFVPLLCNYSRILHLFLWWHVNTNRGLVPGQVLSSMLVLEWRTAYVRGWDLAQPYKLNQNVMSTIFTTNNQKYGGEVSTVVVHGGDKRPPWILRLVRGRVSWREHRGPSWSWKSMAWDGCSVIELLCGQIINKLKKDYRQQKGNLQRRGNCRLWKFQTYEVTSWCSSLAALGQWKSKPVL